ncbi:hypothetical protein [Riemerella columbipharyngis]|uniref:Uncharacterized protein n=1 Tax=Riemerella columbipharyngis TaxID=1071918 RepID=A0A1G7FUG4_9FLAO|nr:hypothetical protein [Riemerella columbipharyngis]SDE79516.1 hypothetical protein SAMN05421544_1282 [Riemerella columbipharyngis]
MEIIDFKTPEFILAEIPIKDGSFNDKRLWVYCPSALSLMEFVCGNDFEAVPINFFTKKEYINTDGVAEEWGIAFTQNNCEATEVDEQALVERAWKFFKSYLEWEDRHIDEERVSKMN